MSHNGDMISQDILEIDMKQHLQELEKDSWCDISVPEASARYR